MTAALDRPSDRSALGKDAAILDAIGDGETRLSAIARRVGLPVSTTHRILHEAAAFGWVRHNDDMSWSPGDRSPKTGALTEAELRTAGDALHKWCLQVGIRGSGIDRLRPHGAARYLLRELRAAGLR